MEIVIASQNANKIKEIKSKIPFIDILPLDPKLFPEELLEEGETLEANAIQKVKQVYAITQSNCFADDTGLEIPALNNEPGVYSARYAGPQKNSKDNMSLVLEKLENTTDRHARFRTVIALIWEGELSLFEGVCQGKILTAAQGHEGFGYDPIFQPEGFDKSFAEMSLAEKNEISHRASAINKLANFLASQ